MAEFLLNEEGHVVVSPSRQGVVDAVSDGAFMDRRDLASVELLPGVDSVGSSAFRRCRRLESVSFSPTTKEIGPFCFENCISLNDVALPDSLVDLGHSSFRNCTSLKRVAIPKSITAVPMGIFSGCRNCISIDIPEHVHSIGTWAFSCTSIPSMRIPSSVEIIGQGAFFACPRLSSIQIPSSVKFIGEKAFGSCGMLHAVEIQEGLEELGPYAFSDCPSLGFLHVPGSVRSFERWFGFRPHQTAVFAPGVRLEDIDSLRYAFSFALGFVQQDIRKGIDRADIWLQYRPFISRYIIELCRAARFGAQLIRWLIASGFVTKDIFKDLLSEATQEGYIAGTAELLEHATEFGVNRNMNDCLLLDDDERDYLVFSAGFEL